MSAPSSMTSMSAPDDAADSLGRGCAFRLPRFGAGFGAPAFGASGFVSADPASPDPPVSPDPPEPPDPPAASSLNWSAASRLNFIERPRCRVNASRMLSASRLESGPGRLVERRGHAEHDHVAVDAQRLRLLDRGAGGHRQLGEDSNAQATITSSRSGTGALWYRGDACRHRLGGRRRVAPRPPRCATRPARTRASGRGSAPVPTTRRRSRADSSFAPERRGRPGRRPRVPSPHLRHSNRPRRCSSRSMRSARICNGGPASRRLSRTSAISSTRRGSAASVPRMSTTAWPSVSRTADERGVPERLTELAQPLLVVFGRVDPDPAAHRR